LFGRIVASDATTESRFAISRQIEIASFRLLKPGNLANSKPRPAVKLTPAQWLGSFLPAN
jgi:hypothetical protein